MQDGDGKVTFNTILALSYEVNILSKLDKTLINIQEDEAFGKRNFSFSTDATEIALSTV